MDKGVLLLKKEQKTQHKKQAKFTVRKLRKEN